MTLLDQCKIWNENDEYQKIIEALEKECGRLASNR